MANTKRPPAPSDTSQLRHAIVDSLARHERVQGCRAHRIAIAYSGGVDSSVLLHVLAGMATDQGTDDTHGLQAIALHVHHGLSPNADAWLAHCVAQCEQLKVPLHYRHVTIDGASGESIEAAARAARYAALQALCEQHETTLLLTAHHADDQAETVILNLLRGSGVAGLAGMAGERPLGKIILARPFLALDASVLHAYARQHALLHIEDESNRDTRYTRNAIRHGVLPALRRITPAATQRLVQTASHAGEAQALLDEIGRDDLIACDLQAGSLRHSTLRALSPARAANVLRAWFRSRGLLAPSTAALSDMLRQIRQSSPDTQLRIDHDSHVLHAYRDRLLIEAAPPPKPKRGPALPEETRFTWANEAQLDFPQWQGRLRFTPTESEGLPASWLRNQDLRLSPRRGGERLKLHAQRPTRSLKNLYQESAIPAWQRARLPLLHAGPQLLMAAGLGVDAGLVQGVHDASDALIRLEWESLTQ